MPTKSKPAAAGKKSAADTVESVMGSLTKEAVAALQDKASHDAAEDLRLRALGIATVLLSSQPMDVGRAALLTKKGITLTTAKELVAEAAALMAAHADHLAKEAALKTAKAADDSARAHAHVEASSAASLLRAALGNTSADLKLFGVPPLGTGGGSHKPPAAPADGKPQS